MQHPAKSQEQLPEVSAHRGSCRQAEQTLPQTPAFFERVFALSPMLVKEMCPADLSIRYVGSNSEQILGFAPQEIVGVPLWYLSRLHPEDHDLALTKLRATVQSQATQERWEYRFLHRDGNYRWMYSVGHFEYAGTGELVSLLSFTLDITERKRLEEEARENELRTRLIIETAHDAFIAMNAEGRIVDWNRQAEVTFGWSREQTLGHFLTETIIPPEHREAHRKGLQHFLETGEGPLLNKRFEILALDRDGHTFPMEVRITPIPWKASYLFSAFLHDIRGRKQSEEHLRQTQKIEAIGRLAGGVAHDFNNMLTVINCYCDLLLGRLSPEDRSRQQIKEIRKAGERAATLTGQLLAFSRKQVLEPKVINLNPLVAELEKMLRRLIGEDIALITIYDPALRYVKADPGQIEQVLMNLVVNARDAMPQGGELTIETHNVELDETSGSVHPGMLPGPFALLRVQDTGCGMDETTKARIFEPFFTTKGLGRGTGLGLAMVHGIIEQSGGYLLVESAPGQGTTFCIYLPITKEMVPLRRSHQGMHSMPQGTETILLVEDEEEVREIAKSLLKANGYTILEARDGAEALQLGKSHSGHIELLLTDVVMPKLGGPQLAELLGRFRPSMKVLYVSGYTDDALGRHGVTEGEAAFLQKPFTPTALVRKVREVLGRP